MPQISPCPNIRDEGSQCFDRRVSVRYTEVAYATFNAEGSNREDGHDIERIDLDFEHGVYCRGCHQKRALTEEDIELLVNDGEIDDQGIEPDRTGKDEEGQ